MTATAMPPTHQYETTLNRKAWSLWDNDGGGRFGVTMSNHYITPSEKWQVNYSRLQDTHLQFWKKHRLSEYQSEEIFYGKQRNIAARVKCTTNTVGQS